MKRLALLITVLAGLLLAPMAPAESGSDFQALARALDRAGLKAEPVSGLKSLYAVAADVSGVYFNPAQSGHGFMVQHIVSNGEAAVLVAWFAYLDGEQRWMFGIGSAVGNEVRAPLVITSGGDFPPRFVPTDVAVQPWGELILRFDNPDRGRVLWSSTVPGFGSGEMPIERLTTPASSYDPIDQRVAACHSGSWYDPSQGGHGLLLEVIGPPENRQMLAIWYAYLNGQQRWLTALGPVQGASATMEATITSGGNFPPNFNPAAVQNLPWGTLTFTAIDADNATLQWNSSIAGYGSGSMPLSRLTALSGSGCGPTDDAKAARFLTQATFGPKINEIAAVRNAGYAGWIAQQQALAPTLHRPTVELQIAQDSAVTPRPALAARAFRLERWFNVALNAPDQLRQRVAFALSQIMVVSDTGSLDNTPVGVAEFNDILVRNAFGNYRDLLREVTLSPMMGIYLTHLRNQKTDWTPDREGNLAPSLITPDENYAREVMQLFSIGLLERNRDFSPILQDGLALPTYTQDLVTNTAKVLTGFAFPCTGSATIGTITLNRNCGACTGVGCNFSTTLFFANPPRYASGGIFTAVVHPDQYRPMVCYPRYADTGRSATNTNNYAVLAAPHDSKTLLAGITVGPSPVACHTGTTGADQQACMDYCNGQLETLISSLHLHPNVPPMMARQLIQRLTTSNPSPGYIERVAAVFEDDGSGVRGNLGAVVSAILLDPEARADQPHVNFGKLREPLLKLTAIWRAFSAVPGTSQTYGMFQPERFFAQRPLGAESVFNFYEPDYAQPGEIADADLVSPEFQILNESTIITTSDVLWALIFNGYSMPSPTQTNFATPTTAYLPPSSLDALPTGHAALIEALNLRMLNGQMSEVMRSRLQTMLDTDLAATDHRRKALNLIHLIGISAAFAVQH